MALIAPRQATGPESSSRWNVIRWLDLKRLFLVAILLALLIPAIQPVTDPDFWWHLTAGNWILDHHAVPRYDLFTFTVPDHRWITHEWLSEVFLAMLFRIGALPLVSITLGLITALGFVVIWRAIDRQVNFIIAGLSVALGVAVANPIWGPRIQMITFVLTALTYLWIKRFCESNGRGIYFLPALIVLWANLHAGFFIAYVLLGVTFVAEAVKVRLGHPQHLAPRRLGHLALIGVAGLAAAVVNPNGWDIYPYALQTQVSPVQQQFIAEWLSPNFHLPEVRFFEAALLLLLAGLALARRIDLRQFLLLVVGVVLALQSVRHLALFVIVAIPPLATYLQQAWQRFRPGLKARGMPSNSFTFSVNMLVLLLLLLTVTAASAPVFRQPLGGKRVEKDFPVKAADFIAAHPPPGHMLDQYGWGGYLIYRLYPGQHVFVYGDAAVEGDQLLLDYAHLTYLSPDQAGLLAKYDINWVIFKSDQPIITELRRDPTWFQLGVFGQATILMRETPENRSFASVARLP